MTLAKNDFLGRFTFLLCISNYCAYCVYQGSSIENLRQFWFLIYICFVNSFTSEIKLNGMPALARYYASIFYFGYVRLRVNSFHSLILTSGVSTTTTHMWWTQFNT
ncbi:hypothetical protein ACJX0J_014160 [Zea mays]